nr:uncharacterized protein LOC109158392 [Ipomoea batatas]
MAGAAAILFTRQRQTAALGDDGSGLNGDLSAFSRRSPARSETALAVSTAGGPWQRRNLCRLCVSGDSNPVLRHGHYFLICINVKASKLEIIDNKSLVRGVTMKDKYGDCTTLLVTALKEYLALGSSAIFWKVDELTEEVVDMSWKESENYIDCGLFVMKHMETYKGTLKKWNPGFRKKASLNEDFLIGLRARYAATIIRWRANTLKNIVIKKTKLLYNEK